jgi:hypothetical protein
MNDCGQKRAWRDSVIDFAGGIIAMVLIGTMIFFFGVYVVSSPMLK